MKPIKIKDQKILALAEEARTTGDLHNLWGRRYIRIRDELFKAIDAKFPELKDKGEPLTYNHETNTISSSIKTEEKPE